MLLYPVIMPMGITGLRGEMVVKCKKQLYQVTVRTEAGSCSAVFLFADSRTGCLIPSLFLLAIFHQRYFPFSFHLAGQEGFFLEKHHGYTEKLHLSSRNLIQALPPSMAKGETEWLEVLCHLSDLNWSSTQPSMNCVHLYFSVTQAKISSIIHQKANVMLFIILEILVSRSQTFGFRLSFMGGVKLNHHELLVSTAHLPFTFWSTKCLFWIW